MTQVCPVCDRRGTVAPGFYEGVDNPTTINTQRETCRACGGTGMIE